MAEVIDVVERVARAIYRQLGGGSGDYDDAARAAFAAMLEAVGEPTQEWTSAVEMLVPASVDRYPQAYYIGPNPNESRVGHRWELWTKDCRGKPFRGHHINSSSLALAIACLKARGDRMAEIARHASLCNFITGLGDGLCDCGLDQALTEWRDQ